MVVARHLKTDSDSEVLLNIFADEIHRAHQRFVQVKAGGGGVQGSKGKGASGLNRIAGRSAAGQADNLCRDHGALCWYCGKEDQHQTWGGAQTLA